MLPLPDSQSQTDFFPLTQMNPEFSKSNLNGNNTFTFAPSTSSNPSRETPTFPHVEYNKNGASKQLSQPSFDLNVLSPGPSLNEAVKIPNSAYFTLPSIPQMGFVTPENEGKRCTYFQLCD